MDFLSMPPVLQALIATIFTWGFTALGAAMVFLGRLESRKLLDASLGFAAGIMISASFFSLLLPAIEIASKQALPAWIPTSIGFLLGGLFMRLIDMSIPHLHMFMPKGKAEGFRPERLSKVTLLVLAVTIHNFPEGLAVGVAFGSIPFVKEATLAGAMALTLGIAIQNFPEGFALSFPLVKEGHSKFKSFWYAQLSAVVEPVGGVLGALMVSVWQKLLPYAMSFAAGAMIFVVVEELIPEAESGGNADAATIAAILGFNVMMILDLAF